MTNTPATVRATVVVCLTGSQPALLQCLVALADHTPQDAYDVVIVDDASEVEDSLLDALSGDVTVIRHKEPIGAGAACNDAAQAGAGEVLVFLEPDVEVLDGWLPALLDALDADPDLGIAGPAVMDPGGLVIAQGLAALSHPGSDPDLVTVPVTGPNDFGYDLVDLLPPDVVAIRRGVWQAAGGFDAGFERDLAVADLCLTVGMAGSTVACVSGVSVVRLPVGRPAPTPWESQRFADRWRDIFRPTLLPVPGGGVTINPRRVVGPAFVPVAERPERPDPTIGLVIGTYNEESLLSGALDSASGVDDVLVADMESTDSTVRIATTHGARILRLPHAGIVEPGRQAAIDASEADWVLVLDADERLGPGGLAAIHDLLASTPADVDGYLLPRRTWIGRREIRSTGWDPAFERHLRLFRHGSVRWPPTIHSVPSARGTVRTLDPDGPVWIEHLNFADVEAAFATFNRYSSVEARDRRAGGHASSVLAGLEEGIAEFLRRYNPEVDGAASFVMSLGLLMYKFLNHAKAVEADDWPDDPTVPSRETIARAWAAFEAELGGGVSTTLKGAMP